MTSTLKFTSHRSKGAFSPFETAEPSSPGPPLRRTARRWQSARSSPEPPSRDEPASAATESPNASASQSASQSPRELSNVELLVQHLRDPPDAEQRIRDYDWYMHYHTDELLNGSTVDVKDVEKYVRASELASGAVPEDNPRIELPPAAEDLQVKDGNVQYYETWLGGEN